MVTITGTEKEIRDCLQKQCFSLRDIFDCNGDCIDH